ncbi:hypothetical protein D9M68_454210 [compost metagenome]
MPTQAVLQFAGVGHRLCLGCSGNRVGGLPGRDAGQALLGQVVDRDLVRLRSGQGVLQGVAQLADVAWPGVGEEGAHGVAANPRGTLALLAELLEDAFDQVALVGPLTQ